MISCLKQNLLHVITLNNYHIGLNWYEVISTNLNATIQSCSANLLTTFFYFAIENEKKMAVSRIIFSWKYKITIKKILDRSSMVGGKTNQEHARLCCVRLLRLLVPSFQDVREVIDEIVRVNVWTKIKGEGGALHRWA